ncbi:EthD domain-containing protein [Neofusicoccum parvum]|nr:EthD domain-containing protein [Neofusicoccum parvum]
MPYTVLIFAYRKPGLTPEEFKNHYENVHVPLIKSIAGDKFPLSHTRSYIHRTESKEDQGNSFPATVLAGTQDDFCYDAISEMKFKDVAAFQQFHQVLGQGENGPRMDADNKAFLDLAKLRMVMLGDVVQTTNDYL